MAVNWNHGFLRVGGTSTSTSSRASTSSSLRSYSSSSFRPSHYLLTATSLQLHRAHYLPFYLSRLTLSISNEIISSHVGPIRSIHAENIQSRYLLTSGLDCKISLYDLYQQPEPKQTTTTTTTNYRQHLNQFTEPNRITSLATSSKGENNGHNFSITSVKWYPTDNESFFSTSFDGKLAVWETELFEIAGDFVIGSKIYDCALHPQGSHSLVACATEKHGIRLCDFTSGGFSHVLGTDFLHPTCVNWCPYHEYTLVSGHYDGTVRLWDTRKAGIHAEYLSFDFLQDHQTKIDRTIHQKIDWNRQLAVKAHTKPINAVKFNPNGSYLVSCGNDKVVRLWNVETGKLLPIRYDPCCSSTLKYEIDIVGFSSSTGDELLIYPGVDRRINLTPLHSSTGKSMKSLQGHLDNPTSIQMLTDYRIVSAGLDGMIFLWEGGEVGGSSGEDEDESGESDWQEKRKRSCFGDHMNEVEDGDEAEIEFIPPIMRNFQRDGPSPPAHSR